MLTGEILTLLRKKAQPLSYNRVWEELKCPDHKLLEESLTKLAQKGLLLARQSDSFEASAIQFRGERYHNGTTVMVTGPQGWEALDPRNDLINHSPTGFEWGYAGSGPAQLALAICSHFLQNDDLVAQVYQEVKRLCISPIERDSWQLDGADLEKVIDILVHKGH